MAEERNRKTLIIIVLGLLFFVLGLAGYNLSYSSKNISNVNLKINQIYSSDYKLSCLDNKYFIGTYDINRIDVIIDENGNEIYKGNENIYYDGIYKLKDDRYLIYDNNNGDLVTYLFDGINVTKYYEIKDVTYVKPIVYTSLDKEYILGFASMIDNNLYLYGLDNSGIIVLNDTSIVADLETKDTYYIYSDKYLVVKNNKELMGVITLDGNIVIDYKYKDIINNSNDTFIALNKKNKYGIIDKNNEVIVKFDYKVIDKFELYYIFVNENNKMALYDSNYERITNYEMNYNTLIEYGLRNEYNSINLYKVNGKIAIVNNYLENINGTEYDKHNLYIIDGKVISKDIKQIGFRYDNYVYSYDNKFNVSVYTSDMSLLFYIKLNDVSKISEISNICSETIMIRYVDTNSVEHTLYYDLYGKTKKFNLGDLFLKDIEYSGYIKTNGNIKTLTLYDLDNNELASVYGEKIRLYDKYLIVDKSIYRIEVKEN
jgi:hypothetical protein